MITFKRHGAGWKAEYDLNKLVSMADIDKISLELELRAFADEIHEIVDLMSAEGQLKREIARRMNNLASTAHAAGKTSAMWSDQNSRFYKQRLAIQGGTD